MKPGAMTAGAHRKHRIKEFLSRFRRDRVRELIDQDANDTAASWRAEFRHSDTVINISVPLILAPLHPWREVSCLLCHGYADDEPIRFVTIIDPRTKRESGWHIGCRGYLVHADHAAPDRMTLIELAHQSDNPGCPCNLVTPVAEAMVHYHYPTGAYIA